MVVELFSVAVQAKQADVAIIVSDERLCVLAEVGRARNRPKSPYRRHRGRFVIRLQSLADGQMRLSWSRPEVNKGCRQSLSTRPGLTKSHSRCAGSLLRKSPVVRRSSSLLQGREGRADRRCLRMPGCSQCRETAKRNSRRREQVPPNVA